MAGKGSIPRPFSVKQNTFGNNWAETFSKQKSDAVAESAADTQEVWDSIIDGLKRAGHDVTEEKARAEEIRAFFMDGTEDAD